MWCAWWPAARGIAVGDRQRCTQICGVASAGASPVGSPAASRVAINLRRKATVGHQGAESGLAILPTSLRQFRVCS